MEQKTKSVNKKKLIAVLAVSLAAVVAIAVVAVVMIKNREAPDDTSVAAISTPVGNFTLPSEIVQKIDVEETTDNNVYRAGFYGTVGNSRVLLFELIVGGSKGDYLLGSAPDKHGKMLDVRLNISEIKADPSWSDEDVEQLNLMQSCVNDIIDQLNNMKGFERTQ